MQPDIAGNTGNIGRSCMALGCRLHLVHPLGFQITDANLKRAGLDYWPLLDLRQHDSVEAWLKDLGGVEPWLYSTKATQAFSPAEVAPGAILAFGSETEGLPEAVTRRYPHRLRRLPMDPRARSLNLSACVAMVLGALSFR